MPIADLVEPSDAGGKRDGASTPSVLAMDAGDRSVEGGPPSGRDAGPSDGGGREGADAANGAAGRGGSDEPTAGKDASPADAGADPDSGDTEPAPRDCDPRVHGELSLWLDAASGVEADEYGAVERWVDRSRHAHVAVAPETPESHPLPVRVAGHPAIQFGNVPSAAVVRKLFVADHASLQFGSDDFALIAVLRHRTPTDTADVEMSRGLIVAKVCGGCTGYPGPMLYANDVWPHYLQKGQPESSFNFMLASVALYSAHSGPSGFNDNQVHLVVARRRRYELNVEVDGRSHTTAVVTNTLDVSTVGSPLSIGGHPDVELQALEGELFELLAFKGDLDLDTTVDCLMAKYGLR